ncbi:MAG: hypothetical protein NTU53_20565 [Planctomycetota bacterium]|nr:hypothetical protein [Planctomycetota bacterium]
MSALTKLFVVLLVVCSLLLTAALVVFVNQRDSFVVALNSADARITQLRREKTDAQAEVTQAKQFANQSAAAASKSVTDAQKKIDELTAAARTLDVENNKLSARVAVLDASVTDLTNAMKLSQAALGDLQKRYDAIMAEADKIRTGNVELAGANTDLQKRLDVLERERRLLVEQTTQLKKENDMARRVLAERNIPLEAGPSKKVAAPNLTGVVTLVKPTTDGVTYASISLGSADKVEKGMQFYVINQTTMEFLGKITIDAVEPRESFGRLEGPRIQDVQKDCQVQTQL